MRCPGAQPLAVADWRRLPKGGVPQRLRREGIRGIPFEEGDDAPLHVERDGPTVDELNGFTQSGNL